MEEISITEKDLIGEIEGFPIEVVRKMVEEQIRQGNNADVKVFQERCKASKCAGGFEWEDTEDGYEFWNNVIIYKEFDEFFEKYPKPETTEMQAENTTPQPRKEIDWEQRRYEIAKEFSPMAFRKEYDMSMSRIDYGLDNRKVARRAVNYADALIAELKKGGEK